MTRRFAIALSFFLIEVVHCAANLLLRPRQGTCTGNVSAVSCPTEDLAFYPLAESLSGPSYDEYPFLRCYYPFVSHCHYNLVNLPSSRPGLIVLTRHLFGRQLEYWSETSMKAIAYRKPKYVEVIAHLQNTNVPPPMIR
jgi:hypothetical protein